MVPADGVVADAKPLRADAVRNREKLLQVATQAFTEKGADASLDYIAKQAGVGIGTLYRHFPTREDLVMAVYGRQVEGLEQRSRELPTQHDPAEALHLWMRGFVDYYAVKQGMVTLLRSMMQASPEAFAEARASMVSSAERLLRPAVEAGTVRADVGAEELLSALGGICLSRGGPGAAAARPEMTLTLVDLMFDGLRYGAPRS